MRFHARLDARVVCRAVPRSIKRHFHLGERPFQPLAFTLLFVASASFVDAQQFQFDDQSSQLTFAGSRKVPTDGSGRPAGLLRPKGRAVDPNGHGTFQSHRCRCGRHQNSLVCSRSVRGQLKRRTHPEVFDPAQDPGSLSGRSYRSIHVTEYSISTPNQNHAIPQTTSTPIIYFNCNPMLNNPSIV